MRSAARTGYIDRARKEAIVDETHSCVMAAQTIAAEKYGANAVDVDDDMMDAVDDIKEIADKADMIVNGYAFTRDGEYIRVLNLDYLNHAAVILNDRVVETNMDDI